MAQRARDGLRRAGDARDAAAGAARAVGGRGGGVLLAAGPRVCDTCACGSRGHNMLFKLRRCATAEALCYWRPDIG